MIKKSLLFGAIASVIAINSVFADTIVTSKQYVDTTRQATIPAAGTNANTPGETVVTYTDTAGTIGERGVCDADADSNDDCENNYLVTRDLLSEQINDLGYQIEQATNLPTTTVTYKTCYQEVNGECILWNLSDKAVYGDFCSTNSDCRSICDARGMGCGGTCQNNSCNCYSHCA